MLVRDASVDFDVVSVVNLHSASIVLAFARSTASVGRVLDEFSWAGLVKGGTAWHGTFRVYGAGQWVRLADARVALVIGWAPSLPDRVCLAIADTAIWNAFAAALSLDRNHCVSDLASGALKC